MGASFEDGQLHDLDIKYDAATKILSVVLDNTTFSESLASKINSQNPQYSFSIAASTGALSAEQTFRFDYMKYVASQNATINYIDENTGETLGSSSMSGNSNSLIKYPDAKIEDYENEGYEVDTAKTDLTDSSRFDIDDTKDQIFSVYLKHKTTTITNKKTVQQKISYEYDDGSKAAADNIQKLTFINQIVKDEVTGKTTNSWTPVNKTVFSEVESPKVEGYDAAQTTVPETTGINQDSSNADYIVKYSPRDEQAVIRFIDNLTGNVISEKQLSGKFGTTSSYKLADEIALIENQGYFVKSSNLPENGVVFNQDGQPLIYTVNLLPIEIIPESPSNPDPDSDTSTKTGSDLDTNEKTKLQQNEYPKVTAVKMDNLKDEVKQIIELVETKQ